MFRTVAVIAWFGIAIVAGLLGSWLWSRHELIESSPQDEVVERQQRGPLLTGGGTGAVTRPATSAGPSGTAGYARDPAIQETTDVDRPALLSSDPIAWIEVEVYGHEHGQSGDAYVLPARAPGTNDGDRITLINLDQGRGALPIVRPGTYDVGYRPYGWGAFVRKDVVVATGERALVQFSLPPMGALKLRWRDPRPEWKIAIQFKPMPASPRSARYYPGRHDTATRDPFGLNLYNDQTLRWIVPKAAKYRIAAELVQRKSGHLVRSYRVRVRPEVADMGDAVTFDLEPLAAVAVHVVSADGTKLDRSVILQLEQAGRAVGPPTWATHKRDVVALHGEPKSATVSWSGNGVVPGRTEVFSLAMGGRAEVTIRVEYKKPVRRKPIIVEFILPQGAPARDMGAAWIDRDGKLRDDNGDSDQMDLKPGVVAPRVVVQQGLYVGEIARAIDGETHRVEAVLGGLLHIVLETTGAEDHAAGPLRIERSDGDILWVGRESGGPEPKLQSEVKSGVTLGPLRPGRHVFRLRRGALVLGEVHGVVEAGRTKPLLIR